MHFFDCNAAFGPYRTRVYRYALTAQQLIDEMDFCGIDRTMAYHTCQRYYDPPDGNRLLLSEISGNDRLVPTWSILPTQSGEQQATPDFLVMMRRHNIRMLRMYPQNHCYFMDEETWADQMQEYEARRIPIYIHARLGDIRDLLRSFPNLVVITGTQGANPLDRYAWPMIDRYPNLHFDTSAYLVDGILESFVKRFGAGRLLFGTGYPDHAVGGSILMLRQADLPEPDKQAIAAENLQRLLQQAQLS